MYKSVARSSHYLARSGSFATHGGRRGTVSIVPTEPTLSDWNPVQFETVYKMAELAVAELRSRGCRFKEGVVANAALAGSQHTDMGRAKIAMKHVIAHFMRNTDGR